MMLPAVSVCHRWHRCALGWLHCLTSDHCLCVIQVTGKCWDDCIVLPDHCLCVSRHHRWHKWRVCVGATTSAHLITRLQSLHGRVITNKPLSSWQHCQQAKCLAWIHSARCWCEKQVNISAAVCPSWLSSLFVVTMAKIYSLVLMSQMQRSRLLSEPCNHGN